MSDRDDRVSNEFYIPNNYTESGRIFSGMFEIRNAIEAAVLGYVLYKILWFLLPIDVLRTKLMVTLAILGPIVVLALVGFQGDSITQTIATIFRYFRDKKVLRYRRIRTSEEKKGHLIGGGKVKAKNKKSSKKGVFGSKKKPPKKTKEKPPKKKKESRSNKKKVKEDKPRKASKRSKRNRDSIEEDTVKEETPKKKKKFFKK